MGPRRALLPAVLTLLVACTPNATPPPTSEIAPASQASEASEVPCEIPSVAFEPARRVVRSPVPVAEAPQLKVAADALHTVVRRYARDPENPWAIAHAMLVLGDDFELTNGEPAVDYLFARYAERFTACGEELVRFPSARGKIRIEPHTDLILKALTEAGVSPDRAVTVQGEPSTVGALYRGSLHRAWVASSTKTGTTLDQVPFGHDADGPGTTTEHWNDAPWSLQALAAWSPDDLTWTADGGHEMTLDRFTSATVQRIDAETQALQVQHKTGQHFDKGQAARAGGLVSMTCGGAHMLQGVAYALGRGFGTDRDRVLFERQIELLFWRYPHELATYAKMMEREPKYRALLMMQRLKFLGHFLETVHKAAALGLFQPSAEQREMLADAAAQLIATVAVLEQTGMFKNLDKLIVPGAKEIYPGLTTNEQLYLDYVGDSAHALRGLRFAMGQGELLR